MALEGTLRDFSLADIFQLIGIQRKTGVLTLRNGREVATISFINGMVVGADTDNQKLENRLGHVLVKTNRISQDELEQALAIQNSTLQRLGQVLISKGFIKSEDLRESLKTQVCEIIYRLFRWSDGDYHFRQERYIDYDQENFSPIGAESILMEGIRMIDEWPMIERVLPNFDVMIEKTEKGKRVKLKIDNNLTLNSGPVSSFDDLLEGVISEEPEPEEVLDIDLPHEQEVILKIIDRPMSVYQVVETSRLNEFETCRAIYDLIETGFVEKVQEKALDKEINIIEEKRHIPIWIPILCLCIVAAASFSLSWNPLNKMAPMGTYESQGSFFDQTVRKRMNKVQFAIDLYYFKTQKLPGNLDTLVHEGFITTEDIEDPAQRRFSYKVHPDRLMYTLFGTNHQGESGPDDLFSQKSFPQEQAPVTENE